MAAQYWLFKSEPETYSFDQLLKDKKTNWDQIRNYQARNNLRAVQKDDYCLIYHSTTQKAVVGLAQCVKTAYADLDEDGKEWAQIDIKAVQKFEIPVSLAQIKADSLLSKLPLIKQTQLSAMPITEKEFKHLLKLGSCKLNK